MLKIRIFKTISISKDSKSGIDLGGSKYDVLLFPPVISDFHDGAKEVQNFKLKVHSGPEGSRGLDYHRNEVFYHKFHLE